MEKERGIPWSMEFISGVFIFAAITFGLLWAGGQEIYTSITNPQPLTMTCQEYLDQRPSAIWVTLTDARLDLVNSASLKSNRDNTTEEVFIALKGKNDDPKRAIQLFLASELPETIIEMDGMAAEIEKAGSLFNLSGEFLKKFLEVKTVTGLIRFGIKVDDQTRHELSKLNLPLAEGFVILDEGKSPSPNKGLILFGLGLLLVGFQVRSGLAILRESKQPKAPPIWNTVPPPVPIIRSVDDM